MVPIVLKLADIDEEPRVTDVAKRWHRFGQDDHVRMYNKKEILERVRAAGSAVPQHGVNHFGRLNYWRPGIAFSSILHIVEESR